jgi:hypothetical protein
MAGGGRVPWAQVDDHFGDSLEALSAGVGALGLYLLSLVWCSSHLSDGHLPQLAAEQLVKRCDGDAGDKMVCDLLRAGLWQPADDGNYQLPLYLRDNRSREQVELDRAAREERAKRAAAKRWSKNRSRDGDA